MKVARGLCKFTFLKYLKWLICERFILFLCKLKVYKALAGGLTSTSSCIFIHISLFSQSEWSSISKGDNRGYCSHFPALKTGILHFSASKNLFSILQCLFHFPFFILKIPTFQRNIKHPSPTRLYAFSSLCKAFSILQHHPIFQSYSQFFTNFHFRNYQSPIFHITESPIFLFYSQILSFFHFPVKKRPLPFYVLYIAPPLISTWSVKTVLDEKSTCCTSCKSMGNKAHQPTLALALWPWP